jgi:hypothetical protein
MIDVAMGVVRRAAALGYRGIAGIDLAILDDGEILVLDLNFRLNGSTAALLLAPEILREKGTALMHLRSFSDARGFAQMAETIRAAMQRGTLLPLVIYNPEAAGHAGKPARVGALVLGDSKEQILKAEEAFAADGWT